IHVEGTNHDAVMMDSDHTFSSLEVLQHVGVASLVNAMRDVYRDYEYASRADDPLNWLARFTVGWSLDPASEFDDDLSLASPVALCLTRTGEPVIEVSVVGSPPRSEDDSWPAGEALLSKWLEPRRGRFMQMRAGET